MEAVSDAGLWPGDGFSFGQGSRLWIYLAGPLAGTLLAVGIARILRGPGGQAHQTKAACTLKIGERTGAKYHRDSSQPWVGAQQHYPHPLGERQARALHPGRDEA